MRADRQGLLDSRSGAGRWAERLSLISGPLPVVLLVLGVLAAGWLLVRRDRQHLARTVPLLVAVSCAGTAAMAVLVEKLWRPFPDPLPRSVYLWLEVGVLAALLAVVPRRRTHRPAASRVVAVAALLVVLTTAACQVNLVFRAYPTVAAALGRTPGRHASLSSIRHLEPALVAGVPLASTWVAPPAMPTTGVVSEVNIPGTTSQFAARPAMIYLPPAYLGTPRAQLPVLVLLAGQPGSPSDWVSLDGLPAVMDSFAAGHHGLAPVVIMADGTGSVLANPLCLDSALGKVDTYLSVDVPRWVHTHLQVDPDQQQWAIGGLSYGGTCSLQMAVNHPDVYPTFLDISGQDEPTLGSRVRTVDVAFGGDMARFRAVNPVDVLARRRFPGSHGVFVVGAQDNRYRPQARRVFAAAQSAGMDATYQQVPGGHDYAVWRQGLRQNLDWLASRLGLLP